MPDNAESETSFALSAAALLPYCRQLQSEPQKGLIAISRSGLVFIIECVNPQLRFSSFESNTLLLKHQVRSNWFALRCIHDFVKFVLECKFDDASWRSVLECIHSVVASRPLRPARTGALPATPVQKASRRRSSSSRCASVEPARSSMGDNRPRFLSADPPVRCTGVARSLQSSPEDSQISSISSSDFSVSQRAPSCMSNAIVSPLPSPAHSLASSRASSPFNANANQIVHAGCNSQYNCYTPSQLVSAIVKRDTEVQELKAKVEDLKRQLKAERRRVSNKQQQLTILAEKHRSQSMNSSVLNIVRSKGGYLTKEAMVALGVRRNTSNVAQADMGVLLLAPITRSTVSRAELRAGDLLMKSSLLWFVSYREALSHHTDTLSCSIFNVSSDETNNMVWQRRKLSTLRLLVTYSDDASNTGPSDWPTMLRVADRRVRSRLPGHNAQASAITGLPRLT